MVAVGLTVMNELGSKKTEPTSLVKAGHHHVPLER